MATPRVGYIINGQTYQDPEGQIPVPEGSIVRTMTGDGTETWWNKSPEYMNQDGTYQPWQSGVPSWLGDSNTLGGMGIGISPQQPQEEVPIEEVPLEEDLMEQIMASLQPQLDSKYAEIDEATQRRIEQLKEAYAARGMYNSDVISTEIDRILEEGEAQKDDLYGQVLASVYQSALQQSYQNRQLDLQQQGLQQDYAAQQQSAMRQAQQWAAEMAKNYAEYRDW